MSTGVRSGRGPNRSILFAAILVIATLTPGGAAPGVAAADPSLTSASIPPRPTPATPAPSTTNPTPQAAGTPDPTASASVHPKAPGSGSTGTPPTAALCQHGLLTTDRPTTLTACSTTPAQPAAAGALPAGFTESIAFSGLTNPTAIQFAKDGRVFVAEKSGTIKIFDSLNTTRPPSVFSTLNTNVDNYWDRGLLGLALDPSLVDTSLPLRPYVYVLYTYDHILGSSANPPRWSDTCPVPPGATTDGCVVSARLSRLTVSGSTISGPETVLIEDWCQQFPSHSIGTIAFGSDGALYVGAGDGANFDNVDYGQYGGTAGSPTAKNPCGDPPNDAMTPPTAEGGALRSQDLQTSADPAGLDGSILRVDPVTGAGFAGNPYASSSDLNKRRIIAYGLRNPFRFTLRPGTSELWLGDVGWNDWEEIDRVANTSDATVEDFGWPCYEGVGRQSGYDGANVNICENLYAAGTSAVTAPVFTYNHAAAVVAGDGCPTGSSAVAGMAFYPASGGTFPTAYAGALFFADHARNCIWWMRIGTNGQPDPSTVAPFLVPATNPVDLKIGPDGALYYVDFDGGTIRRIQAAGANQPPTAVISASPISGVAPLAVNFDGTGSSDPEGGALTYSWDLNGDGVYGDSSAAKPSFTYSTAGTVTVRLRVTDPGGLTGSTSTAITVTTGGGGGSYASTVAGLSPVAYWRLGEGSGTTAADSAGTNTGTYAGGPGLGVAGLLTSDPNTAVHFDGVNDQVAVPDAAALDVTSAISVAAWISADTWGTGNPRILQKGINDSQYRLTIEGGSLLFDIAGVGVASTSPPSTGVRHFVVGTYDRTAVRLYVDNVLVASTPATAAIPTTTDPLAIANKPTSTDARDPFTGTLDEVSVHSIALSAAQIGTLWTAGTTGGGGGTNQPPTAVISASPISGVAPLAVNFDGTGSSDPEGGALTYSWDLNGDGVYGDSSAAKPSFTYSTAGTVTVRLRVTDPGGLTGSTSTAITVTTGGGGGSYASTVAGLSPVAYWRLGEGSGTTAADSAGTNTGTYAGGPGLGVAGLLTSDPNTAVHFDGVNDQVAVPDAAALDVTSAISVAAWISADTWGTGNPRILQKGINDSQYRLTIEGGSLLFDIAGVGVASTSPPSTGVRHFVVGTYDRTAVRLYVDNVLVASTPATAAIPTTTDPLAIANKPTSTDARDPFTGTLDEVSVHSIALSAAQIGTLWTAGTTGGGGGTNQPPTAVISASPISGVAPLAVNFDGTGSSDPEGGALTYSWDLNGDGVYGDSSAAKPSFTYSTAGTVTVRLRVTDPGGLTGSTSTAITVTTGGGGGSYASTVAGLSPVAYWRLGEGSGTTAADSAGTNTGTYAGGPGLGVAGLLTSDPNTAVHFDGVNDQVAVPDAAALDVTSAISVAAWISADTWGTGNPRILQKGINDSQYRLTIEGGSLLFDIAGVGVASTSPPSTGVRHFVVGTYDRTAVRLYVDNVLVASTPATAAIPTTTDPLAIANKPTSTDARDPFTGTLDEVSVHSIALSAAQIGTLWTAGTTGGGGGTNQPPVPVISTPTVGTTWKVGDIINFSGSATDPQDGTLGAASLSWQLVIQHCPSNCHTHLIQTWSQVASGSFPAPDHEYPSYLELSLTATDSKGLSATVVRRLDPKTVTLSFTSVPAGLTLSVNTFTGTTPFTRTVIQGSANTLVAGSPQTIGSTTYNFGSWSDGGAATHTVIAPANASYTATFTSPTATTTTLNPTADAYIRSAAKTSNFGTASFLRVRSGTYRSYLMFSVPSLTGPVQSAKLRLWVTEASTAAGSCYLVGNGWTETGLTWNNAPVIPASALSTVGAANLGTWVEFDVTSAISSGSTVSFAISGGNTNSVDYSSRTGTNAPQLVITSG